jgi:hypothetical protein
MAAGAAGLSEHAPVIVLLISHGRSERSGWTETCECDCEAALNGWQMLKTFKFLRQFLCQRSKIRV